jgi:hypothetical protein
MRFCYLLLLHQNFAQALRLIRRLARENSSFVIHIDSSAPESSLATLRSQLADCKVTYARAVRSRWGSYRQALAIVRCIESAVRDAAPVERYLLLSGQDYPIAAQQDIEDFFAADPQAEYLEAFPLNVTDAAAPGWSPYFRFRRYHLWVGRHHRPVPLVRKGLPPLPLYHGSTWWALTRTALLYLAEQFKSNQRMRRYMRSSFLVDEAYVPSLMMSSPYAARVTGHNVTYARWTPTSGPHPTILRESDVPALRSSGKLFARKFDTEVDARVLDTLDALAEDPALPPPMLSPVRATDPAAQRPSA